MKRIIHHIAILLVCVLCTSVFASCSVLKTEAAKLFGVMSVLFSDETTDTVITDAESTDTAQPPQSDIESEAATEETSVDETTAAEPAETAPDMPLEGEIDYIDPMKRYSEAADWIKPVTVVSGSYPVIIYDGSTEYFEMSVILPELSFKYNNGNFTDRVIQDLYDNNCGGTIDTLKDGTYFSEAVCRFDYYYASWDDIYAVVVCASGGPAYSEGHTEYFNYYFDKNGTPLTFDDCLERKGYTADEFFESFSPYFAVYSSKRDTADKDEMLDCVDYFAFFDDGRIFVNFSYETDNYPSWAYFNIKKTADASTTRSTSTAS